jgi:hypothetical protein
MWSFKQFTLTIKHVPILFFSDMRLVLISTCCFPKLSDQSESLSHRRHGHSLFSIGWNGVLFPFSKAGEWGSRCTSKTIVSRWMHVVPGLALPGLLVPGVWRHVMDGAAASWMKTHGGRMSNGYLLPTVVLLNVIVWRTVAAGSAPPNTARSWVKYLSKNKVSTVRSAWCWFLKCRSQGQGQYYLKLLGTGLQPVALAAASTWCHWWLGVGQKRKCQQSYHHRKEHCTRSAFHI